MRAYHQATASLLTQEPALSPSALEQVEAREHVLGLQFPAAVKEWYALEGATTLLEPSRDGDSPIALADLGMIERGRVEQDLVARGLFLFMFENQGVIRWALRLDGSDDPPVVCQELHYNGPWRIYAERFSTFVYTRVWDWQTAWGQMRCRLLRQGSEPVWPADLHILHCHLRPRPATYAWPTSLTYRFSSPDGEQRILLWDEPGRGADWFLWGTSKMQLEQLIKALGDCSNLAATLEAVDNDCGALVLEELERADVT